MSAVRPRHGTGTRHLCVVLHDVAPSRWDGCTRVLRQLRAVAQEAGVALPVSLLVVPRMHGQARVPSLYLRWLHGQARAGHELVLHGYTHRDEGPPPRHVAERLLRTVYTAGEGEFASLDHGQASARLGAGLAWTQAHDLAVRGFVAPAWLMSAAALDAVAETGFDYTCTLQRIIALPGREVLHAPSLVYSTRAAWRRAMSVVWARTLAWHEAATPVLRLELHPADGDHPAVLRSWSRLLAQALRRRTPLRLHEAAALARQDGVPQPRHASR